MNKKYLILSLFSGLLFGLSWPVNGIVFLIFVAFIPLLVIERELREKSVFKIFSYSFLSFIIWNSITSWWLVNSTVFGMFFAIILYSILMALVFTSYSLISKKLGSKLGVIFFISSWIVFEKFNLSWEFSWPSLILGNVFSESHQLIQWFEFTGTLGGSIWILIVNLLFFKTLNKYLSNKYYLKNLSIGLLSISIPIIISLCIYEQEIKHEKFIEITIIQPNIDPYNKKYGRTNFEILEEFKDKTKDEEFNNKLIITTDHGTINVKNPTKVIGNKDLSSNLRYKTGKSLSFNYKEVISFMEPNKIGLPSVSINSPFIFAKNESFFAYPNNFNHYVSYFKDTYQHGGISMEEMIIPYVVLDPK